MKKKLLLSLTAIILIGLSFNGLSQSACDSPEHRQFDFWLGEWQVTLDDGTVAGQNSISSAYQGCVVVEKYRVNDLPYGTSLNAFDQTTGQWYQTWMDKNGLVLRLTGGLESGNMTLTGSGLDQNGKSINHRIIWQPNSNGTIVQHWQFKHDGDSEWATLFRGTYSKLKS